MLPSFQSVCLLLLAVLAGSGDCTQAHATPAGQSLSALLDSEAESSLQHTPLDESLLEDSTRHGPRPLRAVLTRKLLPQQQAARKLGRRSNSLPRPQRELTTTSTARRYRDDDESAIVPDQETRKHHSHHVQQHSSPADSHVQQHSSTAGSGHVQQHSSTADSGHAEHHSSTADSSHAEHRAHSAVRRLETSWDGSPLLDDAQRNELFWRLMAASAPAESRRKGLEMLTGGHHFSAVVPCSKGHIHLFELLLATCVHSFTEQQFDVVWVVVPAADVPVFADLVRSRGAGSVWRVVDERLVLPQIEKLELKKQGWFIQMDVKLAIAQQIRTPFYALLDADFMCIHKEFDYSQFLKDDSAASSSQGGALPHLRAVAGMVQADGFNGFEQMDMTPGLLGLEIDVPAMPTLLGYTPQIFSADVVLRIASYYSQRSGQDWLDYLWTTGRPPARNFCRYDEEGNCMGTYWTEYSLYFLTASVLPHRPPGSQGQAAASGSLWHHYHAETSWATVLSANSWVHHREELQGCFPSVGERLANGQKCNREGAFVGIDDDGMQPEQLQRIRDFVLRDVVGEWAHEDGDTARPVWQQRQL